MKIHSTLHLSASTQRVWQVIGENFAKFDQWASTFESSTLEGTLGLGAKRISQIKGFGPIGDLTITEELINFDEKKMRYTYVVKSGLPVFLNHAQNTWSIEATGENCCIVNTDALVELKWWFWPLQWIFPLLIKKDMNKIFEEMRYFIENKKIIPENYKH